MLSLLKHTDSSHARIDAFTSRRFIFCLILASSCFRSAAAEDAVYLKPSAPGAPLTRIRGEIVEFTGRELRIQNDAGRERTIPAAEVERVETTRSAEQMSGDQLFAAGDFRDAVTQYRSALEAGREPRNWVRRQVLAQIVWCQRNLGEWDQAGEYFLILLASDADTPDFACLPLVWTGEKPQIVVERKAQQWLANTEQPAAVLMGASQLLTTAHREHALAKLKELLAVDDPRIAWLAFGQLWRAGSGNATAEQMRSFAARIEKSDESLRAGAYFILGNALAGSQPEAATLALMKLPVLYEREYALAASALVTSGECLEKLSRPAQALGLYREAASRYSRAGIAAEARTRIERLASPSAARDNE
jgi:tetratricopeptide (TPR) repeat protein